MDFQPGSRPQLAKDAPALQTKRDSRGGTGSFATRDIDLKTIICSTDGHVKVQALDNARLKDTCYHCILGPRDDGAHESRSIEVSPLRVCSGCKTVRYCSVSCQKSSWTETHKRECKVFKKLYPRVLPSNVRAIMRLILGDDTEGSDVRCILQMQDHTSDLQAAGGERWQNLCLSAKATMAYSGTAPDESTILRLFSILHTNSFTLVTPTYDPIGVALDPTLGRLNHSCEYNAFVRFGKYGNAEVIPIRPIQAGEEVCVSYVDELLSYKERQAELQERYFFACKCLRCNRESSIHTLPSEAAQSAYKTACKILSNDSTDAKAIKSSLTALQKASWKSTTYPVPSLRQHLITAYLAEGQYNHAFVHAMVQSFRLDPITLPVPHHPVRMVHAWLCVRIIDQLLGGGNEISTNQVPSDDFSLGSFGIDLNFWSRAIVVSLHRSANALAPGEFSRMVDDRYNEHKSYAKDEKEYQERYIGKETLLTQWSSVQRAIDFVTNSDKIN